MRRLNLLTGVAISTVSAAGVLLYMYYLRNELNEAEEDIQFKRTYIKRSNETLIDIMTDEQILEYAHRMLSTYAVDNLFEEQMKNF